jgi:hypothetical protein
MLERFADGVWVDAGPVSFLGLKLSATMTVVEVGDGLLVLAPLPLTPERQAAVTALGSVAHLYAPNTFHHSWLGDWSREFPRARVHAPAALAAKRPDLRIDRAHDEAPFTFGDVVDEVPIRGFRLVETALVHRPTGTAIVTDLVHNIGRPTHTWTKLYTKLMGFYDRVALSRMLRWTAFDDRGRARESVDRLLALPFEHLIVGHGTPLASHGHELLATATRFLPAAKQPKLPRSSQKPPLLPTKPCG